MQMRNIPLYIPSGPQTSRNIITQICVFLTLEQRVKMLQQSQNNLGLKRRFPVVIAPWISD